MSLLLVLKSSSSSTSVSLNLLVNNLPRVGLCLCDPRCWITNSKLGGAVADVVVDSIFLLLKTPQLFEIDVVIAQSWLVIFRRSTRRSVL